MFMLTARTAIQFTYWHSFLDMYQKMVVQYIQNNFKLDNDDYVIRCSAYEGTEFNLINSQSEGETI